MKTYKGLEIRGMDSDMEWISPGRYYLIQVCPQEGPDCYVLREEPGRTNRSHEVRLHGWLGTTDNVARYAEGCVEVYKNKAGHIRIRPCGDIQPEALDG